MQQAFNVLALIKGAERYVYVFDDDCWHQLIEAFRDQAADPRLSLTWFDAAVLMEKARQQVGMGSEASAEPRPRMEESA